VLVCTGRINLSAHKQYWKYGWGHWQHTVGNIKHTNTHATAK